MAALDKMFKEIVKLQPVFEENYSKGKQWKSIPGYCIIEIYK